MPAYSVLIAYWKRQQEILSSLLTYTSTSAARNIYHNGWKYIKNSPSLKSQVLEKAQEIKDLRSVISSFVDL